MLIYLIQATRPTFTCTYYTLPFHWCPSKCPPVQQCVSHIIKFIYLLQSCQPAFPHSCNTFPLVSTSIAVFQSHRKVHIIVTDQSTNYSCNTFPLVSTSIAVLQLHRKVHIFITAQSTNYSFNILLVVSTCLTVLQSHH